MNFLYKETGVQLLQKCDFFTIFALEKIKKGYCVPPLTGAKDF